MARRLELRTVTLDRVVDEKGAPMQVVYSQMIETILRWAPQGQGLTLDEVTRAMDVLQPLQQAVADGASEVVLTDTQWQTLVEKLDAFRFGVADSAIVTFGKMIKDAPEIGTEPVVDTGKRPRAVT